MLFAPDGFDGSWITCSATDGNGNVINSGVYIVGKGIDLPVANIITIWTCSIYAFNENADPPQAAPAPTTNLTVNTWSCDTDLTNVSTDQWLASCAGRVASHTVLYTDTTDPNSTQAVATDGNATLTVPINVSTYQLQSPITAEFNDGQLLCAETDANGAAVGLGTTARLNSIGQANVQVAQAGDAVTCWFLFYSSESGSANAGAAGLNGTALLCDNNLMDLTADQLTDAVIAASCPLLGVSVPFTLSFPDGTTQQMTSGGDGSFAFAPLPAGNYALSASASDPNTGTTMICRVTANGSAGITVFTDGGSGRASFSVSSPSDVFSCKVLLYDPAGPPPGTAPTNNDTNSTEIDIVPKLCPDGFSSTNLDQLTTTCTAPKDPMTFTLAGDQSQDTTGDPPTVSFVSLIPNTYSISQTLPDGFGGSIVFCSESAGAQASPVSVSTDNAISVDAPGGGVVTCQWFNTTSSSEWQSINRWWHERDWRRGADRGFGSGDAINHASHLSRRLRSRCRDGRSREGL